MQILQQVIAKAYTVATSLPTLIYISSCVSICHKHQFSVYFHFTPIFTRVIMQVLTKFVNSVSLSLVSERKQNPSYSM